MKTQGRRRRLSVEAGVTAVELMTVVGLMGIASAFAFSSLQPYAQGFRLKGAAMSVAAELSRTKQDAVRSHLCHYFVPVGTTQYKIVRDVAGTPNCIYEVGDTVVRTITITNEYSGVSFATGGATTNPYGGAPTGATPTNIRFEPRGTVTLTGGSSVFLSGTQAGPLAITVTAAGSVRVWQLSSGTWK